MNYKITARIWRYPGPAGWYFITFPRKASDEIRCLATGSRSAWGSIRVEAVIGQTRWQTSLFPDSKKKTYLLPVKAQVREKEGLAANDEVRVAVRLLSRVEKRDVSAYHIRKRKE